MVFAHLAILMAIVEFTAIISEQDVHASLAMVVTMKKKETGTKQRKIR